MSHHWLVAGVGRSGTTAIYEALQTLARGSRRKFSYFYEPYLWGPPTWVSRFRDAAQAFTTTNSIHAYGLRCHLATPLFASEVRERSPVHADFVQGLFNEQKSSLTKIIRGCGRLKDYLDLDPNIKVVFVTRNPLDCVNSAMENFSFFGDEFHPSDLPRFRRELGELGRPQPAFATECEAATAWWHEMNQAALRSFEGHRDRVFIAPYEAYTSDQGRALRRLAKFLALDVKKDVKSKVKRLLDRPVGQVTRRVNLRIDDRDHIAPFHAAYLDLIDGISDIPISKEARARFKKIGEKYEALEAGAFTPDVPRDASPLRVRALVRRETEALQTAMAGVRQAREYLGDVEVNMSGRSSGRS